MMHALPSHILLSLACLAIAISAPGCSLRYPMTIAGRVTDAETGEPIPGVVVGVKGSKEGAYPVVTNRDGKFSLPIVATGLEFAGRTPDWKLVCRCKTHQNTSCQIDFSLFSEDPEKIEVVLVMQTMVRRETPAIAQAN